ncbi:MAG: hypothetical protein AMXMBFR64_60830 [Myxococcales bacterium]
MSTIVRLKIDGVKRIRAAELVPDPKDPAIWLAGPNGAGKSTVLDSIEYALGGAKALPPQPIQTGQQTARIVLELSDGLTITRRMRLADDGSCESTLVAERAGAVLRKPQDVLDALAGKAGMGAPMILDPLRFVRETTSQAATLRAVAGIDTSALDARIAALEGERRDCGRDGKLLAGQAAEASAAVGPEPAAPADAPPSTADAARAALAAASAEGAEAEQLAEALRLATRERDTAEDAAARAENEVDRLRRELEAAESVAATACTAADAAADRYDAAHLAAAARPVPDLSPLRATVEAAIQADAEARRAADVARAERVAWDQRRQRAERVAQQTQEARERYAALTAQIETARAERVAAIEAAKWPVPGLGIDGDVVTYRGLPLEQASQAEQLRVACAVGLALRSEIRVLLVRDASLLDAESRRLLVELAREHDAQVWAEVVDDDPEPGDGVIIVMDGGVRP